MRYQFATPESARLLAMIIAATVFVCHPIRNRLYVPLALAAACIAFGIVHTATGEKWAGIAQWACSVAYVIAFGAQSIMIGARQRREAARRAWEDAHSSKKRKRGR